MKKTIISTITIVFILIITIVLVAFMIKSKSGSEKESPGATEIETSEEIDTEETQNDKTKYSRLLGLVTAVDSGSGSMQLLDIEKGGTVTLQIKDTVLFENEYGALIAADEIVPGYIVNVKYDIGSFVPESVKIAAQVQTIKNLSSFVPDEVKQTIQIGSDIYTYTKDLIARNGDTNLVLSDITIADEVVIRTYQGKIWSILVDSGHGYIILKNYEDYMDGIIQIGDRTTFTITADMRIPVKVGINMVSITKETMTPYTSSVFIEENAEYAIDLGDSKPKVAEVVFNISQQGAEVYVDDQKLVSISEPLVLPYGEYTIKVMKTGFKAVEEILIVNQPYVGKTIKLVASTLFVRMTGPAGAEFYIDGMFKAVTTLDQVLEYQILPGKHTLILRQDGYETWKKNIVVEEGTTEYNYYVPQLTPIQPEPEPIEPEDPTDPADPTEPTTTSDSNNTIIDPPAGDGATTP